MVGTWTFNASANVLTVVGGTSGIIDAWNADQANGWNVVHKQGSCQFLLDCKLKIGDYSTPTYFSDANKQIAFSALATSATRDFLIQVIPNGHFKLGTLVDAVNKITANGCTLISELNPDLMPYYIYGYPFGGSNSIEIYSSTFIGGYYTFIFCSSTLKVYNSQFYPDGCIFAYSIADVYNLYCYGGFIPFAGATTGTFDTALVNSPFCAFSHDGSGTLTLKNFNIKGATYLMQIIYDGGDAYLINIISNVWTFAWNTASNKKIYRQYEFDLAVTDKDNNPLSSASVELKDKDGNTVFSVTTDAYGAIVTQTVSRGFYQQSTGNTLQEYSPHTLTVTKAGYQKYVKKFTLSEKTKWAIKLARAQAILLGMGKPVVNLCASDPENKYILHL